MNLKVKFGDDISQCSRELCVILHPDKQTQKQTHNSSNNKHAKMKILASNNWTNVGQALCYRHVVLPDGNERRYHTVSINMLQNI